MITTETEFDGRTFESLKISIKNNNIIITVEQNIEHDNEAYRACIENLKINQMRFFICELGVPTK